ncbi:MAG: hypothetical protein BGP22_21950 [Variovorax sp. 67-131]|nr:MAG: hypothetical protein ABS94_10990 [Variovorax sp. SCN 67-85]ODV23151.1 MAG: hypothetical protein ABT25_19945 [Variovorax sp. SCN 67-20]OJZ15467.1 MAG: hypothetical protein BGP22_21950 [Variovorax sp. 67-131]
MFLRQFSEHGPGGLALPVDLREQATLTGEVAVFSILSGFCITFLSDAVDFSQACFVGRQPFELVAHPCELLFG